MQLIWVSMNSIESFQHESKLFNTSVNRFLVCKYVMLPLLYYYKIFLLLILFFLKNFVFIKGKWGVIFNPSWPAELEFKNILPI